MTRNNFSLIAVPVPLLVGLALALWFLPLGSARADPGVLYAAPTAQGSGDCSSWANACTLQTALTTAISGDEIWVKMGVHYPGAAGNRTATFTLKNDVALYGGFAGTETARDQRDWQANITILSGDIDRNDLTDPYGVVTDTANITGTNAYHVTTGGGVTETAVLDGFFITAGQADDGSGGGMLNDHSSPTLVNVTFTANSAECGGGMYNRESSPTLANAILWGDSAATGAEIHNNNSTPNISYSDIQGCGGSGGGWDPTCGNDGGGNTDTDPLFVDAVAGNLHLRPTSPAIDAGNNDAVPSGVVTDLDGNPRFVDIPTVPDTGYGTPPIVDMGAYEAQVNVVIGKAVWPPTATPGQAITFTITIANRGSITATHIVVTDTLPAILTGLSFTSTAMVTDTGHVPPYVWTVEDLAPGQGGMITVSGALTVPLAAGIYTNTALIFAEGDLPAENNTAIVNFTVSNVAPAFTSAPITTATQDTTYTYTAAAVDYNGDALTITAAITLPSWLTLADHGDGTATLCGTPGSTDVGDHTVVLRVTDNLSLIHI